MLTTKRKTPQTNRSERALKNSKIEKEEKREKTVWVGQNLDFLDNRFYRSSCETM